MALPNEWHDEDLKKYKLHWDNNFLQIFHVCFLVAQKDTFGSIILRWPGKFMIMLALDFVCIDIIVVYHF